MNIPNHIVCSGCASLKLSEAVVIRDQPVILNYRFDSPKASAEVPLRTMELRQCWECGLVFNAAFEDGIVPYDKAYENRQSHSAAFAKHTMQVAKMIGAMMESECPRILEVGCGKGQFLRQVVGYCEGEGVGYDTSYEGPDSDSNLTFHAEYLSADAVPGRFDAVVCRHVVEHVPRIGAFLGELAAIARASGNPFVFIETPRLEWILEHKSSWDIFYEHCNYFTEQALRGLCQRAGFLVMGQYPVFSRQYQLVVLACNPARQSRHPMTASDIPHPTEPIWQIEGIHSSSISKLASLIDARANGGFWAIWGAGAKGVCLANRLPKEHLARLIDTNPAKQGFHVPGTHIPIQAPSRDTISDLQLIVIANPSYESEIRADLANHHYNGHVLVLSESLL
jgi:ubiquinone/menaquinone biosynthesis C-methylase UbiE